MESPGTASPLETVDDFLHFLRPVLVRNQDRVGRLDHHYVLDAHAGHQTIGRHGQRVAAIMQHDVPLRDVAVVVLALLYIQTSTKEEFLQACFESGPSIGFGKFDINLNVNNNIFLKGLIVNISYFQMINLNIKCFPI